MPNAADLKPDSRFMGLFVGPKGCGKTAAACSFPGRKKVFDFDGRIRGILGCPWVDKSLVDYTYYPPKTNFTQANTFEQINKDLEQLLLSAQNGMNAYSGVILDSLTSQTFALVCDALPLTHGSKTDTKSKGKSIGSMMMPGPEDYGFEAQGTYQILAFLRSVPGLKYVIVTAHIVPRYGKLDPDNPFSESVEVGEKLSVRDKIGANSTIYFDHIFKFGRKTGPGDSAIYTCKFRDGDLATTAFSELPSGQVDITGVNFYERLMAKVMPKE